MKRMRTILSLVIVAGVACLLFHQEIYTFLGVGEFLANLLIRFSVTVGITSLSMLLLSFGRSFTEENGKLYVTPYTSFSRLLNRMPFLEDKTSFCRTFWYVWGLLVFTILSTAGMIVVIKMTLSFPDQPTNEYIISYTRQFLCFSLILSAFLFLLVKSDGVKMVGYIALITLFAIYTIILPVVGRMFVEGMQLTSAVVDTLSDERLIVSLILGTFVLLVVNVLVVNFIIDNDYFPRLRKAVSKFFASTCPVVYHQEE